MDHETVHRPSYARLALSMDADESVRVEAGSMVGYSGSVDVRTQAEGGLLKSLSRSVFGGEGLFLLTLSGSGPAFLSSYGAIDEVEVGPGDSLVVDTGHIVAFEETLEFSVERVGGLKSTLFSGEGLVCEFSGEGTVWTQTRSPDAFLSWLIPKLPVQHTAAQ
jgi:uncharacterized protein (AIM24 family)